MSMKKRSWAERIKRARRLSNKTEVFNRIRGIVGEFIGESLEKIEGAFAIHEVHGLAAMRSVFVEIEELFGGRNVYISDRTYITKDFFLEMLSQYLKVHQGEERAILVMRNFFGITNPERYFSPEFHLKPGQTIEKIKDREQEYKSTVQEVGEFLIDQVYQVGSRGKILWRVNWVEDETVELERLCEGKNEYKKVTFAEMRSKYRRVD